MAHDPSNTRAGGGTYGSSLVMMYDGSPRSGTLLGVRERRRGERERERFTGEPAAVAELSHEQSMSSSAAAAVREQSISSGA
jgi:hypothetical protein